MRKLIIAIALIGAVMVTSGMLLAEEQKEIKAQEEYGSAAAWRGTCLDLDEEQKAKLNELRHELEMAAIDLKADLQKLRLELKREMMKDEPSRKAVDKLVEDIGAARTKLKKLHIDHAFKAKEMLKPEQWKQFIMRHMREGRGGRDQWGPGDHRGIHRRGMRMLRRAPRSGRGEHEMMWFEGGRRGGRHIKIIEEDPDRI
jgi:Spy/CpxP family protein refolding chaperone